VGVLQCLGLLEISDRRVHYPTLGVGDVGDLAAGAEHDADEDAGLVLEQEGAERDGEDQSEVFGPVTGEHAEGDAVHRSASGRFVCLCIMLWRMQLPGTLYPVLRTNTKVATR